MPSHTPSSNEWRHDDDTHEDQYKAELLRQYKGLIHDRVGHEREALPDIKNIRVSAPEKYSGEDDIEVFDTWLNGLLRWFRVYNVTGDHKDSMRVDLCGTTLTGHGTQTKLRLGIEGPGNGTSKTSSVACINDLYMKLPRRTRQTVTLRLSSRIVRELWHSITNSNAMQATWYNPLTSTR